VRPAAIVVERLLEAALAVRVLDVVREKGISILLQRVLARLRYRRSASPVLDSEPLVDYCATRGIAYVTVEHLDVEAGLDALRHLAPDLAIHAGAGILRSATLAVPRLGTLNAHMGLLPAFRGMNTAEWSVLTGHPVGCTIHLIDEGVDTGDVLCSLVIPVDNARSIEQLREIVDRAQLALLGDVVAYVAQTGALPPRHAQARDAGRQFFRMHDAVRTSLERWLGERQGPAS
jgi:methionyl-tRNA formyltransferase